MTAAFDTARAEPKFDRYGRYVLPDVDGGKEKSWTRATTFAKSIADTFGLTQWEMRMVAAGIGQRRDLYALAAAASIDDKDTLNRVAKDAKEAAAASSGANLGTALHSFTEAHDRGEPTSPPPPWDADLQAYAATMTANRILVDPQWVERIVVLPELGVAGQLDRVVQLGGGPTVIADVKTGKDLSYAWTEISIQLALYANASHAWNPDTRRYDLMPPVDRDQAIVMHLPAGKATCTIYDVDIAAGWQAAQLCKDVRAWRSRKNLAGVYQQPLETIHAKAQLTKAINTATCEADLIDLWQRHMGGTWDLTHTAAATRRKQELYANA